MSKWIPCSERLPEVDRRVFVTCVFKGENARYVCKAWMDEKQQWWYYGTLLSEMDAFVLAWQPLPEPWEGEENG